MHQFETLLHAFKRMHQTCFRQMMDQEGMGELTNPALLFVLLRHEGEELTQRDLAECMGISPPTATISIKRMERAGLVLKEQDQNDLRKNRVVLTEKGRKLSQRCVLLGEQLHRLLTEGFTEQELAQMCHYFERMIHNMEGLGTRLPSKMKRKVDT